jgi:hypothetical protein
MWDKVDNIIDQTIGIHLVKSSEETRKNHVEALIATAMDFIDWIIVKQPEGLKDQLMFQFIFYPDSRKKILRSIALLKYAKTFLAIYFFLGGNIDDFYSDPHLKHIRIIDKECIVLLLIAGVLLSQALTWADSKPFTYNVLMKWKSFLN